MSKPMPSTCKKKNCVSVMVEKLQKSLSQAKKWSPRNTCYNDISGVPKDVKEGHFAVIAVQDDKAKRFVVPVAYLQDPNFKGQLEKAAEEYGFDHKGAVVIPCSPSTFEDILAEQWEAEAGRRRRRKRRSKL